MKTTIIGFLLFGNDRRHKKVHSAVMSYADKKWHSTQAYRTAYIKFITNRNFKVSILEIISEIRRCYKKLEYTDDESRIDDFCKSIFLSRSQPFHLFFVRRNDEDCVCIVSFPPNADSKEKYRKHCFPISELTDKTTIIGGSAVYIPTRFSY